MMKPKTKKSTDHFWQNQERNVVLVLVGRVKFDWQEVSEVRGVFGNETSNRLKEMKLVCEQISETSSHSQTGSPADSPADFLFLFQAQCHVLHTTCRTCWLIYWLMFSRILIAVLPTETRWLLLEWPTIIFESPILLLWQTFKRLSLQLKNFLLTISSILIFSILNSFS